LLYSILLLLATAGSDAAFIIIMDGAAINPSLDHTALVLSLFNYGARANLSFYLAALYCLYLRVRPQGGRAASITVDIIAMMVPIDSSRQELSNGGHIVILVKFDRI